MILSCSFLKIWLILIIISLFDFSRLWEINDDSFKRFDFDSMKRVVIDVINIDKFVMMIKIDRDKININIELFLIKLDDWRSWNEWSRCSENNVKKECWDDKRKLTLNELQLMWTVHAFFSWTCLLLWTCFIFSFKVFY
jgi:hypothetical protein